MLTRDPVKQWPKIALYGRSQVIPHVCPNCLAPAELEFRYSRSRFGNRRLGYIQSFYYCEDCADYVLAEGRFENCKAPMALLVVLLIAPVYVILAVLALFGSMALAGIDLAHEGKPQEWEVWVLVAGVFLVIFAVFLAGRMTYSWLVGVVRRRAIRRKPIGHGQAVWGRAAYCTDAPLLANGWAEYRAVRPEWIRALVEANPDQVHDDAYLRVVGVPKPPPEQRSGGDPSIRP